MSEYKQYTLDFLKIIGDKTRLDILNFLKDGEKSSAEIQEFLKKSQSTISQHLKNLLSQDLIDVIYKEVLLTIENPKKPGETIDVPKGIKYYKIRNDDFFDLLGQIESFVADINKAKLKEVQDLDRKDTLRDLAK